MFTFPLHCVKVLCSSFSKVCISTTSHQKAFIFGPQIPWRVSFHSMTPDPRVQYMPQGWARGKNLWHLSKKKCFPYFSVMKTTYADSWSDICRSGSWSEDQHDLNFTVQWICLISVRLFDFWCMNIILWDYELVWPDIWPQNKCRSLWPIFHGPVTFPYVLKTFWCTNIIFWLVGCIGGPFDTF